MKALSRAPLLILVVGTVALLGGASLAEIEPGVGVRPVIRAGPAGDWRWPLDGVPLVVRDFDPPPEPWLPGHRGVDLASTDVATVRAAGSGVVAFAGMIGDRGVVSVAHAGGLRTTYEPVRPLVVGGQEVRAGDALATLVAGHPGCPRPACLHWGLRRGSTYLDPLLLVRARRVRLLGG